MNAEKNSLLVYRAGGRAYQVLPGPDALYVIELGDRHTGLHWSRVLAEPEDFEPGLGRERIAREAVERVYALLGEVQTEILLKRRDGGEYAWHMSCPVPPSGLQRIFDGLSLELGKLPPERALVDEAALPGGLFDSADGAQQLEWERMAVPPESEDDAPLKLPGPGTVLEAVLTLLCALAPLLWWVNQSRFLFAVNLLLPLLGLALLARGRGSGRRGAMLSRLLWLLPGISLGLANARINLIRPVQLALPAVGLALLVTLLYAAACGRRRGWKRALAVFLVCLAVYAPGAALSVNAFRQERLQTARATPVLIREGWIDARTDGGLMRLYARPEVCRALSPTQPCNLELRRGLLGVEYWVVVPPEAVSEI